MKTDWLTGVDVALLRAIQECSDDDGAARSFFRVAVVHAGLAAPWARSRLRVLEALGYVQVERDGSKPMVIRVVRAV